MLFFCKLFLKKLETFKWLTYVETFVNKFGEYSKKKKRKKEKKKRSWYLNDE